ncbi:MAG: DMT family transporter [Saccharospirillum sp.]|uniref:DMT family transporter n=1 Tax=Saccharospirillum sp. TaxID=2033801 RepID=UPI003298C5D3
MSTSSNAKPIAPVTPKTGLALLGGLAVIAIWSGWLVLSRLGVQTVLTPADITLLRYVTAALCTLPWALTYPWRSVRWGRALVVALGCGFPYTLLSFYGLQLSPAAQAGVLVNGSLPVISGLLAILLLKQRFRAGAWLGVALVVVANGLMVGPTLLHHSVPVRGLLLLFAAAWVMSIYMTAIKAWQVSTRDILVWVPWINGLMFIPIWWLMPHVLPEAPLNDVLLQVVYQGIIVSVLALFLLGFVIRELGSMTSSLFMAYVPASAALLAIPVLSEWPGTLQWAAIALCTLGLMVYGRSQQQQNKVSKK